MNTKELVRDIVDGLRRIGDSQNPVTARPEILDKCLPARKSERVQFLEAQRQAGEEYASNLLAKDAKHLTPEETTYLNRETVAALRAFERGELE